MVLRLGILPGDGIGPEIVSAARRAVEASQADAEFVELPVGWEGYERHGSTVPETTLEALEECDGWFLGPILAGEYPEDDPANQNPSSTLRSEFDLYANVRPIRAYESLGPEGMEVTVFRQNTEGFLADRNMHIGDGRFMPTEDTALSVRVVTRKESRRIAEAAFAHADAHDKDVTAVHKGNVLKHGEALFLEECRAVADDYPDVTLETSLVDAFAMELVRNPTDHDVVVTTNLFGDILSDEAAGVVGSLGVAPGLNYGAEHAMAQASHGAAPDIAGEGIANPAAMILSAAMLLEWIESNGDAAVGDAPATIETAVNDALDSGVRTPDIGGDETTETFTDAVVDRITP
ncbi:MULTISPECIES: isocitrate/isopropylmalate dehydrogenase family protein [Halorussus]|uniref:isocitrate/isopropylmalate dehydrogenase family protein n=1 Tax=Halorussus TaxID=1070314 RepID=UPI000E212112|nr:MULTISPECIES: isocitrate/isopropylmalate family dehydrogenase [Halorussus]NHN61560.1 isocitrate/isopropylmalate dehydrogenase family protein [Halorussus sp. JP-T4]